MSTLNVKVPDEMDEDIEAFIEDHPHYLNKSELARDALRHLIEPPRLSDRTLEDDRASRHQIDDRDVVALDDVQMADIFFTERGRDRLNDLDPETQERIKKKLGEIEDWPDHFLRPLQGRDDHVLRVGDYRALFQWEKTAEGVDVLNVKSVGHRRNFYDREVQLAAAIDGGGRSLLPEGDKISSSNDRDRNLQRTGTVDEHLEGLITRRVYHVFVAGHCFRICGQKRNAGYPA